ncbi:MAG: RDD family protein [Gammaproteobacteria bacterium]|nr:RDD family protein [Gammaproteobacteria bacterium]MDE2348375.1 RDD family protein [Gammaproteobacteria bacterium]
MTAGTSAGFGLRLAALIYDAFILAALLMIFTAAAMLFTHGHALLYPTIGRWVLLYRAGLGAVIAGYFVLNWHYGGQTVGMRAWRLVVVDLGGGPPKYAAAVARLFWAALAWAPLALGVLWLYVDSEGLTLQDRLSDTRMVRLPRS